MTPSKIDSSADLKQHFLAAARALEPLDPTDAKANTLRFHLLKCMQATGAISEALALCEPFAKQLPDRGDIAHLMINLAIEAKAYDAALAAIEANARHFAAETEFLRTKAVVLTRAGRDVEALPVLEKLRIAAPDHVFALLNLGRIYRKQGAWSEADSAFQTVLATENTSEAGWVGRVNTALAQRDLDAAWDLAQDALVALPHNHQVLLLTARVLTLLDRLEEAQQLLEAAHEDWAGAHPGVGVGLAQLRRQMGDFSGADAAYEDILRNDSTHKGAWVGRLQNLLEQGDVDRALTESEKACSSCPDTPPIIRLYATALRRAGRDQDAIDVLEKLHRDFPDNTGATLALAGARRHLGDLDEADRLFAEVLKLEPENWNALQGRVAIAETRQNYDAALALLEGVTNSSSDHLPDQPTAG